MSDSAQLCPVQTPWRPV